MKKGTLPEGLVSGSPERVIAHAKCLMGKKQPSMFYKDERNPRKALALAEKDLRDKKVEKHLKKYPETEMECWATIESLGGFIWRMNHDLADGRIESNPEIEKNLKEMQGLMEKLVSDLSRFGVIPLRNYPRNYSEMKKRGEEPKLPRGKILYRDWYKKMKIKFYTAEYEKLICSACPLSEGLERFMSLDQIPCSEVRGSLYNLHEPFICGMMSTSSYGWSRKRLLARIRKEGGPEASLKFRTKEAKLKAVAVKEKELKKAAAA